MAYYYIKKETKKDTQNYPSETLEQKAEIIEWEERLIQELENLKGFKKQLKTSQNLSPSILAKLKIQIKQLKNQIEQMQIRLQDYRSYLKSYTTKELKNKRLVLHENYVHLLLQIKKILEFTDKKSKYPPIQRPESAKGIIIQNKALKPDNRTPIPKKSSLSYQKINLSDCSIQKSQISMDQINHSEQIQQELVQLKDMVSDIKYQFTQQNNPQYIKIQQNVQKKSNQNIVNDQIIFTQLQQRFQSLEKLEKKDKEKLEALQIKVEKLEQQNKKMFDIVRTLLNQQKQNQIQLHQRPFQQIQPTMQNNQQNLQPSIYVKDYLNNSNEFQQTNTQTNQQIQQKQTRYLIPKNQSHCDLDLLAQKLEDVSKWAKEMVKKEIQHPNFIQSQYYWTNSYLNIYFLTKILLLDVLYLDQLLIYIILYISQLEKKEYGFFNSTSSFQKFLLFVLSEQSLNVLVMQFSVQFFSSKQKLFIPLLKGDL